MDCPKEGCKGSVVAGRIETKDEYVEVGFVCTQEGDEHRFFTRVRSEDLCEDN